MGTPWQDNLGALFTHDGIAETIYSTSTVDVAQSGTTTIDCWAQAPGAQWLHTTRDIVIASPANDNEATSTPPAAAINSQLIPEPEQLPATGTE